MFCLRTLLKQNFQLLAKFTQLLANDGSQVLMSAKKYLPALSIKPIVCKSWKDNCSCLLKIKGSGIFKDSR